MSKREVGLGKLTLTLRIEEQRDDGYHELSALTCFLQNVNDIVELEIKDDSSDMSLEIFMDELNDKLTADKNNLVLQAINKYHELLQAKSIAIHSFSSHLYKQLPIQAGLGGGSVDAAATLRLLNEIYNQALSEAELYSIASSIGSDVSSCLYSKVCWMKGTGEIIEPLNIDISSLSVLVVTPEIYCSTPEVYKHYDKIGKPKDEGRSPVGALDGIIDTVHNDLSLSAYDLYPELLKLKNSLERKSGHSFELAGSGSTLFAIDVAEKIYDLYNEIKQENYRLCKVSSLV